MKNLLIRNTFLILFFCTALMANATRTFVHPGISHKLSDLERMRIAVQNQVEPWYGSYLLLQTNKYASYNYAVQWRKDSVRVVASLSASYEKFKYDALASYYNALMWYITGDSRHAEKAIQIFNAMSNIKSIENSATKSLDAGRVIWKLMEGAEIIKSTYSGWKQEDIDAFKKMLVYPGYSTTKEPTAAIDAGDATFYWYMYNGDYGRHGNQGLFGMRGIMAMGIFLDNEIMYERALRYLRGQPHHPDDLPYPSGPPVVSSTKNGFPTSNSYFDDYSMKSPYIMADVPDYGYNEVIKNYIWENGQSQEASRDQGHSLLALTILHTMSEMSWNQGDNLFNAVNYRQRLGLEYSLKYNVSYAKSYPDQPNPWEPTVASGEFIQRRDRSQRWFSRRINPFNANDTVSITRGDCVNDNGSTCFEMLVGHYQSRLNLPAESIKWMVRANQIFKSKFGNEQQGFQVDHAGYTGLTFHRTDSCAGDPVTFKNRTPIFAVHKLPGVIQVEDYDFFIDNPQSRTYLELSDSKKYNAYRPDSAVTVESCPTGGYQVSDMVAGEWLNYTVSVPRSAAYNLVANYSTITAGAKLRVALAGRDKTTEVLLPVTGEGVLADCMLARQVYLQAGIHSLRIYISGASNTLKLNSLSVLFENTGQPYLTLTLTKNTTFNTLSWSTRNFIPASFTIYRATVNDFAQATVLQNDFLGTSLMDYSMTPGSNYYYWVKTNDGLQNVMSNMVTTTVGAAGEIDHPFTYGTNGWSTNTSGATLATSNGILKMTMAVQSANEYRGDLTTTNLTVHAGKYPILALKMAKPSVAQVTFDTPNGPYGGGSNNWTGADSVNPTYKVYYYDLTAKNFIHPAGTITTLPTDTTFTFPTVSFKVAGVTSGETSYTLDWIKSFASLADMRTFIAKDSVQAIFEPAYTTTGTIALTNTFSSGKILLNWTSTNLTNPIFAVYRNRVDTFNTATALATGLTATTFTDSTLSDSDADCYYWIQTSDRGQLVTSASTRVNLTWGSYTDDFTLKTSGSYSIYGWRRVSAGTTSSLTVTNPAGKLLVNMITDPTNGGYMGPIYRYASIDLHAGINPILAIKATWPTLFNLSLGCGLGTYANATNAWTGRVGSKVLYYDLRTNGFTLSGTTTFIPTENVLTVTKLTLGMYGVKSGETSYTLDWIKTFRSVQALKDFVTADSMATGLPEKPKTAVLSVYCSDNRLYMRDLTLGDEVMVFDLQGRRIIRDIVQTEEWIGSLPAKGLFVVRVRNQNQVETTKVMNL